MIIHVIPDGFKDDNQVPPIRMFRIAAASPLSRGKGRTSHNSLGVRPNLHRKASV